MFLVRIDKAGWETFSGQLGLVPFKDGVSTRPLTDIEMRQIGASIRIVRLESNEQVGPAVAMVDARSVSAEVKTPLPTVAETEPEVALEYDRDTLEKLADEGGIKAVREIAAKFGVKGVGIDKMIEDILEAQRNPKPLSEVAILPEEVEEPKEDE